jgi:polar amino acid transport system substrate-binding protein
VDRAGALVGVIAGSAYDLFLTRELQRAAIVRAANAAAVMDLWSGGELDAVAGVKPLLEADARRVGGLRLLPERFMAINQAMGTPRERMAGARYLAAFVDEMKSSGFVARAFARNRITGAAMAP